MKLVIDISEEVFDEIYNKNYYSLKGKEVLRAAVRNSTPLPKGHGRIVDIGQIDKDKIEKDNPIICLSDRDGAYLEVVSLDYLDSLQTIVEADKEG